MLIAWLGRLSQRVLGIRKIIEGGSVASLGLGDTDEEVGENKTNDKLVGEETSSRGFDIEFEAETAWNVDSGTEGGSEVYDI